MAQAPEIRLKACVVAAVALLLGGCTSFKEYFGNGFKVGPNYCRPPACTAQRWLDADDVRVREKSEVPTRWWTVFNDPALDRLIECAMSQNLSLREAGCRVLEARAELAIIEGRIFPQSQYTAGSVERVVSSGAVSGFPGLPAEFFNVWNYGFNLTWELDFWGRYRRAIASADDSLDASVAGYDEVMITLLGDVAATYVQIRTLETRIEYASENVDLQRKLVNAATKRHQGGRIGRLDLAQTSSVLDQTESAIPQLQIDLRQAHNRLCVLLGTPPYDLEKQLNRGPIPVAPKEVAIGIPADLLRRRPDVRRAERLAAAQGEQIGIAQAALYPAFAIRGTLGWESRDLRHLFTSDALNGNFGPAFQWNILNYGRLTNNVRLQKAQFQELVFAYQNTVLRANAEVENALVTFLKSHKLAEYLDRSVDHAKEARDILVAQYEAGAVDPTRLMLVSQTLVQQQDRQAQAHGEIALGLVQVYRTLAGGWEIPASPQPMEQLPTPPPIVEPAAAAEIVPPPVPIPK